VGEDSSCGQPVYPRHLDVQESDVGTMLLGGSYDLVTSSDCGDHTTVIVRIARR
jgi:hypothetical protein